MKRAFFFVLVALAGCRRSQTEQEVRGRIVSEWLDGAAEVVRITNDPEAREILEHMKKGSFLARPDSFNDIRALEDVPPSTSYRLALVPLLERDRKLSSYWQASVDSDSHATFRPYPNNVGAITFRENKRISPPLKGVILLHEGKHVEIHVRRELGELERKDPSVAAAIDEYRTTQFESRLVILLGGEKYLQQLQKGAEILEKELRKTGTVKFEQPWFRTELRELFPPPYTDGDLEILQQLAWVSSFMIACENYFGDDEGAASETKYLFFRRYYEQDDR